MPRTSKRAAREQEDAEKLASLGAEPAVPEAEAEEEHDATPAGPSAFAALAVDDQEDEDDSEPEVTSSAPTSGKKKKKRRKPKTKTATEAIEDAVEPVEGPSKAPSAAKKEKVAPLDDIDRALRDLNAKYATTSGASEEASRFQSTPAANALKGLLATEIKYLDAEAELKRMFGAKVVASAAANQPARRGAGAHNPHHKAGRARAAMAKPNVYWPPIHMVKSGLTMEPVDDQRPIGSETWHSLEHSRGYKEAQSQFLQAVSSHDPNSIFALLAVQPYHIDSLLQLSDIQSHQGDQGQAEDFLDRALYAMERAFAPTFQLTSGMSRLSFRRVESRAMFRALERKVSSLMRRGCWRAAFEFARLLLSLSPYDDPYGALLFLDFLAPKVKQTRFLEQLIPALREAASKAVDAPLKYETYPGLAYGHALALFEGEAGKKHEESSNALVKAILRFPAVVLLLYDKLDLPYPKSISSLPRAQQPASVSSGAPLVWTLSQLYVHRSDSLWKAPEVKAWLQEAVRTAEPKLNDQNDPDVALGWTLMALNQPYGPNAIPHGIARHILAADIAPIKALLPPSVFSSQSFSYDLLPPVQEPQATFYDNKYFNALGGRRAAQQAGRQLTMQRLMQMLQAQENAEDVDQLQAIMAQLTEMQLDDEVGGTMPGGLDDDFAPPAAPGQAGGNGEAAQNEAWPLRQAPGALMNWLGRFGGGRREEAESDDE